MKPQTLFSLLLPLIALPLAACGQTTVNNPNTPTSQAASTTAVEKLTQKLESTYAKQNIKVISVTTSPIPGLYEVVVSGNQIIYVDEAGKYMLVGDLIDIESRRSLTEERSIELNKIDWNTLPLNKAIKEVRGNGKLKVAVFSDPDCPFCKRLEQEFTKLNNITIYNFMMPIASLHPQAHKKAEQIWCQPNRTTAWTAWMRQGKLPPSVPSCDNPVAETTSLGEQLGFNGTPTLIFPNGTTQSGFSPMPQLETTIKENQ